MSNSLPVVQVANLSHYLQTVKVDSFKLRIEAEKVQIVSTTFCEKYQKIYITGELEEEFNLEKHKTNIENGITTRIGVVSCTTGKDRIEEFIYFQVNAKMCKSNYLSGVTKDTISQVYDHIINQKIVYVTFQDFLNGYVTDIDFAYDVEISHDNMKKLNNQIYGKIREDKMKFVDKPFGKQENIGLQFNRRDKATPTSPFIKIYHKGIEFEYKSQEFYNEYLSHYNLKNYGRLEFTLKNARHQKQLGIEIRTLNQLVNYDRQIIEPIVLAAISENYIEKKIIVRDYSKLSPTNRFILYLINEVIERGGDKITIYKVLETFSQDSPSDRRDKSRLKKLIDEMLDRLENGTKKQLVKNKEINGVLRLFSLD
jgi:hypothetical protein